ncbi:MAG: restriction endonuclease subunit S [Anaerovibrio sp.]|uniref:restriction endonuclease subunit S n=1 Tax=Anaerovibrio sp. TaxID=1872532 RepID=UPI002622DDEF|nr:restriction endonuclease subunit S [Anaerovibrio sp.]MDD7677905.1 restriction endonuclease subunit S [Anaerovibrio sp.]MDY2603595.1 restriction endonuclease subunit S [Anaerovibrio sp.]
MKDSGIEWIGKIPQDWDIERIQWHLEEVNEINNPIQTTYILSLNNKVGVIPYDDRDNMGNKAKDDYSQYKLAYPDTLVMNSMNVIIGSVGISKYFGCVSPVYYVFKHNENTDLRYINYIFQCEKFQKELRKYANGILEIRLRISVHDTLRRCMPCPNLSEQKRIADYLDEKCTEIDNAISKTTASIEEYKKLKQSIITKAVTKGIRGNRPMKDSGIEWIGEIPADWEVKKIKWILSERKKRSVDGKEEPLSMSQKYGLIPTKNMDSIPNMASSFVGAKIVQRGDLVFNKLKAYLGVFSVSDYNGLVSPDYAVYHSKGNVNVLFLEYLFKTPQCINEFNKLSSGVGAGLTRLYTSDLFSIKIAEPSKVEQDEIADYIKTKCTEIDIMLNKKNELITELEAYKKSLIYEYVTGKKEVV